jgi:hypothetical protein
MSINKIKDILNPKDIETLDATLNNNWVPREPRELLLPYISEEEIIKDDIEIRREKAKEVYKGYEDLEKKCKSLRSEIEEQSKGVEISLKASSQLNVMQAVSRTFGTNGEVITFSMYKKAIEELNRLASNAIPKIGK